MRLLPLIALVAVSLSFDDGRPTQMDAGLPVLSELGLKVTFYVVPGAIEKRQTAWRAAAQAHDVCLSLRADLCRPGPTTTSYVPLINKRFLVGRLWMGELANDPSFVDLSQVHAVPMDDKELAQLKPMLDGAVEQGRWLVLGGHDIGAQSEPYTTRITFLRALAEYLKTPERGIWVAPVGTVAEWVAKHR